MDLQASRNYLMEWLKGLSDPKIMAELEQIARSHQRGDWWLELPEAVKRSIKKGEQDIAEGKVMSRSEAKALLRRRQEQQE